MVDAPPPDARNRSGDALLFTDLPLPNRRVGKVRDVYDAQLADGTPVTVLVATDRISAFDCVMPNGVPGKGRLLTAISRFWFDRIGLELGAAMPHHALSFDASELPGLSPEQVRQLAGRVTIGRRCRVIPVECVVRGYLAGSGWAEYERAGSVCGVALPAGLGRGDRLPEPIFTPTSKAASGHDEPMSFEQMGEAVGGELATTLRDRSLAAYRMAHDYAAGRGIIVADTKFEFGLPTTVGQGAGADGGGSGSTGDPGPILVDEALTPDSSRFWPREDYEPGRDQPSFDKQYVRDFLQGLCDAGVWDKTPPAPSLPEDVVAGTRSRYEEALRRLSGVEGGEVARGGESRGSLGR